MIVIIMQYHKFIHRTVASVPTADPKYHTKMKAIIKEQMVAHEAYQYLLKKKTSQVNFTFHKFYLSNDWKRKKEMITSIQIENDMPHLKAIFCPYKNLYIFLHS